MRSSLSQLVSVVLVACSGLAMFACGARTPLDDPDGGGGKTGGEGGAGEGGSADGGAPPATCNGGVTLTEPAFVPLSPGLTGAVMQMTNVVGGGSVCGAVEAYSAIPERTGQAATFCADAWSVWPPAFDDAFAFSLAGGGLALAEGRDAGYALLLGHNGTPAVAGPMFAADVISAAPSWVTLDNLWAHRAAFVARRPDGVHDLGLVYVAGAYETLVVTQVEAGPQGTFGDIACATFGIVARGVSLATGRLIATSSGASLEECLDGVDPGQSTRVLLVNADSSTGPSTLFEFDAPDRVDDIDLVNAGDGSVWLAWQSIGSLSIARIGVTGTVLVGPMQITDVSVGSLALAMRGNDLLVAHIDASDPDLAADVVVTKVDALGASTSFGGFDTSSATWSSDVSIVSSPDGAHVLVGYLGVDPVAGGSPKPVLRRFDCHE
ncbi:MAG: hypothetical protein HOW73_09270 [Polyangiaceae bacterium]|nr:hypothetical protein [Polyangiaceae bacterium]